ncbi:zinc-binding dehydrogenase [Rhodococcus qingshengii]|uniref:zinc-binding dehydrogenase n=1 Tax=Rhodococcus qingshengii TaxID=334542 RepID=UPI00237C681A|nr:zinc-binding dehydrogenase [Rhodococcus qingshengii]WCT05783.1 zinc-binding dehydrogenase [Rhodococcus qingshengii]
MKAYVVRLREGQQSAVWENSPDPTVPPTGVVVKVTAAGLAWSDALQIEGAYVGKMPDLPFVAGHEFAGVVVDAAVDAEYRPGERVFGFLPSPAAFAEYVAVRSEHIRRTPDELSDLDAAAFTTSFLTADMALFEVGMLAKNDSVLIHAGAGGVGRCAIQLAACQELETVMATAGTPARRSAAETVGATATAGYDTFDSMVMDRTNGRGVNVVLESIGGDVFDRSVRVTAPLGRVVTIGASSGTPPERLKLPLLWQRSVSVFGLHIARLATERPDVLQRSWDRLQLLLAAGKINSAVGMTVSPMKIGDGINALRTRSVGGRVVIDFSERWSEVK